MKKLATLLLTTSLLFSCSGNDSIMLNTKEFPNKAKYIGTVNGIDCFRYEINGNDILVLNKGVNDSTKYDFTKLDSLKIKEIPGEIEGIQNYAIESVFNSQ